MVRQSRTGRFGQALALQNSQDEEVTPELIREEPRVPEGRFGSGLKRTEALRERAKQLSSIRGEAISEANRLEELFFGQRITTAQAEEEYNKVDPRIRQFIKTTPQVRRQMALKVLSDIDTAIASNESAIINQQQRGGSEAELDILERQQIIQELNQLRDEAESGAFTFEDLIRVAEAKGRARRSRAEQREVIETRLRNAPAQFQQSVTVSETRPKTTDELVADGIPRQVAEKISSGQPITLEEFYLLPKNIREQSGLTREDFFNGTESENISALQRLRNRIDQATKTGTFRERLIFGRDRFGRPSPLSYPSFIEAGAEDIGNYLGDKAVILKHSSFMKEIESFGKSQSYSLGLGKSRVKTLSDEEIKKSVAFSFDVATLPTTLRTVSFSLDVAGRLVAGDKPVLKLTPAEREVSALEIAGASAIPVIKGVKYLREGVIIKEGKFKPFITAETEIENLGSLTASVDIGKFTVAGIKEANVGFVAPRGDVIFRRFIRVGGEDLSKASLPELQLTFPRGREIKLDKQIKVLLGTENFPTKNGKVLSSLRGGKGVGYSISREVESKLTNVKIGTFSGQLDEDIKLLKQVNPKKLSKIDEKLFKEAVSGKVFSDKAQFFKGSTLTKDLYKLTRRDLKLISAGKRRIRKGDLILDYTIPSKRTTLRGRLAGVQQSEINMEGLINPKVPQLKEFEVLKEDIAFADITYPRVPRTIGKYSFRRFPQLKEFKGYNLKRDIDIAPRRVDTLKGITYRTRFDIPSVAKSDFQFFRTRGTKKTPFSFTFPKQNQLQNVIQKFDIPKLESGSNAVPIQAMKGALGLRVAKEFKSSRLSNAQIQKQFGSQSSLEGARQTARVYSALPERQSTQQVTKLSSRLFPKLQTKQLTDLSTKTLTKQLPRLSTKQVQKLTTKLVTKLTPKEITKSITVPIPIRIPTPRRTKRFVPIAFNFKQKPFRIPRQRRARRRSDLALVESFTARELKLRPQIIRAKDIGKALARQQNIALPSLRTIVLPDRVRRRRKR